MRKRYFFRVRNVLLSRDHAALTLEPGDFWHDDPEGGTVKLTATGRAGQTGEVAPRQVRCVPSVEGAEFDVDTQGKLTELRIDGGCKLLPDDLVQIDVGPIDYGKPDPGAYPVLHHVGKVDALPGVAAHVVELLRAAAPTVPYPGAWISVDPGLVSDPTRIGVGFGSVAGVGLVAEVHLLRIELPHQVDFIIDVLDAGPFRYGVFDQTGLGLPLAQKLAERLPAGEWPWQPPRR